MIWNATKTVTIVIVKIKYNEIKLCKLVQTEMIEFHDILIQTHSQPDILLQLIMYNKVNLYTLLTQSLIFYEVGDNITKYYLYQRFSATLKLNGNTAIFLFIIDDVYTMDIIGQKFNLFSDY